MRRRVLLACAPALAAALAQQVAAQQAPRVRQVGMLMTGAPPHPYTEMLPDLLRALGWRDGSITFEVRHAGEVERATALAAELVGIGVDVIVCHLTPAVLAARRATRTIPIVMMGVGAALENGLVASLARPGGNVTGVADLAAELGGRRLQVLRDIIPDLSCVGVLASSEDPFARPFVNDMVAAGERAGIRVVPVRVSGPAGFAAAFATMTASRAQAVVVQGIFTFSANRMAILEIAARDGLPMVALDHDTTAAGGLFSLLSSWSETIQRGASFVDRILKGADPAALPVEQPTTFDLHVNLRTARALGLVVPQSILVAADEVIE
jgi:putative ABC transport system substrate-binding protein